MAPERLPEWFGGTVITSGPLDTPLDVAEWPGLVPGFVPPIGG